MSNAQIILEAQCIACDTTLQKFKLDPAAFPFNMRNSSGRRMRTPNWSVREKQFLLELIKQNKDSVVPKNETPTRHTREKTAAWSHIMKRLTDEFGAKFAGSTIKKVKTQWQNMKRVAREELTARVVSRQSMEVCQILDEQSQLKEEEAAGAGELSGGGSGGSGELGVKQEPRDMDQPGFSVTMDITSNPATPRALRELTSDGSPCDSSVLSEYVQYSDGDDAEPRAAGGGGGPRFVGQGSSVVEPPPPAPNARAGAFDSFATRSLELKLELMSEERHVLRAMRETAELNRTIAEKRLQQVLWLNKQERAMYSGEPGSGAGRGGGGGGSIREAGGAFGKMEAGREEEYFYKKQREQLKEMKTHLNTEISFHEEEIRRHQEAIQRHKEKVENLEKSHQ